jgi:hypothetical protein
LIIFNPEIKVPLAHQRRLQMGYYLGCIASWRSESTLSAKYVLL